MGKQVVEILIEEIRENRKEIKEIRLELNKMDKHIFSNKIKLSIFIAGIGIAVNLAMAVALDRIKHIF